VWVANPVYFLTVCTAGRRHILANPEVAPLLVTAWRNSPSFHGWVVGRFVIMPDHVHFFARPQPEAKSPSAFVCDWKKWTAREIVAQTTATAPVWQSEFFDHVLRSADSYSEKWDYVRHNPVRAGLCAQAEEWPWSGEAELLSY
jgi:REP element-mobilizing transposase RayT